MSDPKLGEVRQQRAKLIYLVLVLAPFLVIWRAFLALAHPSAWNIGAAIAALVLVLVSGRWAWLAWRNVS
jgi:hypothetical protein